MNQVQMKERCPTARLLGMAQLCEYRLAFTIFSPSRKCGCADVIPDSTESVYGLLYEVSEKDMQALDKYEGHPVYYKRVSLVVEYNQSEIVAQTYQVVAKQNGLYPSSHYLGLIQEAATAYNFPREYREFLASVEVR